MKTKMEEDRREEAEGKKAEWGGRGDMRWVPLHLSDAQGNPMSLP